MTTLVWTRYGYRAVEPKPRVKPVVVRSAAKPARCAILDNALLVLAWLVRCIALGVVDCAILLRQEADIIIQAAIAACLVGSLALCGLAALSVALPS